MTGTPPALRAAWPSWQQQNIPAAERAGQAAEHVIRIGVDGVEAAARPTREPQSQTVQHGIEKGVPQPRRRAKKTRRVANDGFDAVLCTRDFRLHALGAEQ